MFHTIWAFNWCQSRYTFFWISLSLCDPRPHLRWIDLNPSMRLLSLMGITMHFGKYVYVPFYLLLMRPFGIPLRMVGWDQEYPRPSGTRLPLLWQMPIAKLLMQFFVVFQQMNFTGSLMWRPLKRCEKFSRPPMREPRRSTTPNWKCPLPGLRKWRWVIWLIQWETRWDCHCQAQSWRKDWGWQSCKESLKILTQKLPSQSHCHWEE